MNAPEESQWPSDGGATADDLAWLADRLVLGELDAVESMAAETRMGEDDAFAAAVARSSRMITALLAAGPTTPPARGAARGRFLEASGRPRVTWVAAVLAGSLALGIWSLGIWWVASLPPTPPQPREMVQIWRQVGESERLAGEGLEEIAIEADVVPQWMRAAVALGAAETRVLEN